MYNQPYSRCRNKVTRSTTQMCLYCTRRQIFPFFSGKADHSAKEWAQKAPLRRRPCSAAFGGTLRRDGPRLRRGRRRLRRRFFSCQYTEKMPVIRNPLYPPRAHTTTTALHVLGMPRHCTGVITGVAAAHGWPGWPCSARVPELQLVSDGSLQRRRTHTALQEGR